MDFGDAVGALVLAAGKGTRLKSETPKALVPLLEEPLLFYPQASLQVLGLTRRAVVVGHQADRVRQVLACVDPEAVPVEQVELLGTGHAVQSCRSWWKGLEHLLILPVDTPLLRPETLRLLLEEHLREDNGCTVLSFTPPDPKGYGRILRGVRGVSIVEERDATAEQKAVGECNSGIYVFRVAALDAVLPRLGRENAQGEYYLTDVLSLLAQEGEKVGVRQADDDVEVFGINDPFQLAEATDHLRRRILFRWMGQGLKCVDPSSTWIGPRARFGADVWLEPHVQIWGASEVGTGSRVGSFSVLVDSTLGHGSVLLGPVRLQHSCLGAEVQVGPFAYLRDETVLADRVHVGRFVEIKRSSVGEGSKVPHLTYLGDATVGRGSNIGAGTITCNYDGVRKNPTVVGDGCFIGSDTMLVAPVEVGDGAATAAGSVITRDVPPGALGVGRTRQRNVEGWRDRPRRGEKGGQETCPQD